MYVAAIGGSDKAAFVFGPLLATAAVLVVGNSVYACIYFLRLTALEAYRINQRSPWPWMSAAQKARSAFWSLVSTSVALTILNCALLLVMTWSNWPLAAAFGFHADVDSFPGPVEVCVNLVFFALIEDAAFYWGHRALHESPMMYRNVHKMHHEYTHTVSIAVLHLHPVEFVVSLSVFQKLPYKPIMKRCHLPRAIRMFGWRSAAL
jgi:sterol desaturase/sphingolipid hydroxylase (fatty acid hydroxylase superfamily)